MSVYLPQLDSYFVNYVRKHSIFNYQPIRLPDITDLNYTSNNVFNLIFNDFYTYSDFQYLFKQIDIRSLPGAIESRLQTNSQRLDIYLSGSEQTGTINETISYNYKDDSFQALGVTIPNGAIILSCTVDITSPCISKSTVSDPEGNLYIGSRDDVSLLSGPNINIFQEGSTKLTNNIKTKNLIELYIQLNIPTGNKAKFAANINVEYLYKPYVGVVYNILNLSEEAITLLGILNQYRNKIPVTFTIDPTTYTNDVVSYLLAIYLQSMINKDFNYLATLKIDLGTLNIFETTLYFYVIDACTQYLSTQTSIDVKYPQPFRYRDSFYMHHYDVSVIRTLPLSMPVLDYPNNFCVYKNSIPLIPDIGYTYDTETNIVTINPNTQLYVFDIILVDYNTEIQIPDEDCTK